MSTHMFDLYKNIDPDYLPDNIHIPPPPPVDLIVDNSPLRPLFNFWGHMIGYEWNTYNSVCLPVSVNDKIFVREDSIIFTTKALAPTINTVGVKGLRAYNTIDAISWICTDIIETSSVDSTTGETTTVTTYTWTKEPKVTFLSDGTKLITLTPDMSTHSLLIIILNFRREEILNVSYKNLNKVLFKLNKEDSALYPDGIYYMIINIISDTALLTMHEFELHVIHRAEIDLCNMLLDTDLDEGGWYDPESEDEDDPWDCDVDGHKYVLKYTKEPWCTCCGYKVYECSECGNIKTTHLDALGHLWNYSWKQPTSTRHYRKCTRCGLEQEAPHKLVLDQYPAYEFYYCTECSYKIEAEYVSEDQLNTKLYKWVDLNTDGGCNCSTSYTTDTLSTYSDTDSSDDTSST